MIGETANCTVTEILQRAKSLLNNEDNAWVGKFPSLCAEIHVKRVEKKLKDDRLNNMNRLTTYITQDIWNIGTIITRLSWMREKTCHDDYLRQMWMYYASVDIEIFHIELRAIMNYVAEIMSECANKKKQVPKSFRKLRQWCAKSPENQKKLGADFTGLVTTAAWFPDILNIRDMLLHFGGYTLVFPQPEEEILFQIYGESYQRLAKSKFYLDKNNVASFKRYAALYLSHLLIFLEHLAELLRHKLSFTGDISNAKFFSSGFDILVQWIEVSLVYAKKHGCFSS